MTTFWTVILYTGLGLNVFSSFVFPSRRWFSLNIIAVLSFLINSMIYIGRSFYWWTYRYFFGSARLLLLQLMTDDGNSDFWQTNRFTVGESPLYEHTILRLLQRALPSKNVPWGDWWDLQSMWSRRTMDDWQLPWSFNSILSSLQVFYHETYCQANAWPSEAPRFTFYPSGKQHLYFGFY